MRKQGYWQVRVYTGHKNAIKKPTRRLERSNLLCRLEDPARVVDQHCVDLLVGDSALS